jgi:hypothetical protein
VAAVTRQISPPEVLLDRLLWMRDRQDRDPYEMLERAIAFGELTSGQAATVRTLLDAS